MLEELGTHGSVTITRFDDGSAGLRWNVAESASTNQDFRTFRTSVRLISFAQSSKVNWRTWMPMAEAILLSVA